MVKEMHSSRTSKSIINIGFNFANQFIILILSFISRTVFIHTLRVEYLGINGLFSDVLGLLTMADLGFNMAMGYSFYKPLAEHDHQRMAELTTFYRKVYNMIASVVTVCGVAIVPFLRNIVNLEKDVPNLEIYYLFSLAGIVVSYLCVYKTSILTADQNNYIIIRISIVVSMSKTVVQIITLLLFKNYIVYLAIGMFCNILNNIIASKKAERTYPFIKEKAELAKKEKIDILQNMKSVFLYKISSVIINATDNILISTIVGTIAVGYYSNYLMIMNKITVFYNMIFSSMTASIGNLIVKEDEEKRYSVFQCEQTISFIISMVVMPCYIVLINDLITVWLGKDYIFSVIVVLAIGLNMYFGCIFQPLWSYREATGLYQKTKWVMVGCAVINIGLSVILGNLIGVSGIIFATSVSRIMTYFWLEPKILFRDFFGISAIGYFKDIIYNFVAIFALTFSLLWIGKFVQIQSWIYLIVKALIVFVICCIVTFLLYRKSKGLEILILKIKGLKNQYVKGK